MPAPRFDGLIAAPHTPMTPAGKLNLSVVPQQAALLQEGKVLGAFVCGSTGESHSLSIDERVEIAEAWIAAAPATFPILIHVGSNCQQDAIELAAHARAIGARAISALAPSYFKPASVDQLVDFMAPIAEAAGDTPFYYYDIPSMTNVRLPADQVLARAAKKIPTFAGLKFTSDDYFALQTCVGLDEGKHEILFGFDEMLLAGLTFGCKGAIGSTYNFAAPLYHRIREAFFAGDLETARSLQRKAVEMVRVLVQFGGLRAIKAMMQLQGVDCGPTRAPIKRFDIAELTSLRAEMQRFDFFTRPIY